MQGVAREYVHEERPNDDVMQIKKKLRECVQNMLKNQARVAGGVGG